jgi:hypothetical protein
MLGIEFQAEEEDTMRKIQITAVFWTLFLAIPLTALALSLAAYLTEPNLTSIETFSRATSAGGQGLAIEMSERWPEVAGMIIGQLVIMTILLFTYRSRQLDNQTKSDRLIHNTRKSLQETLQSLF